MEREHRNKRRSPVLQPIEYLLAPSIIEKTYDGVLTDISDTGACLLTASPLKNRQRIIMLDKSCPFERTAIVRWSEKYDDMFYKIGLEFIEDQTFMHIRDKRRYRRLNVRHLNIQGRMAFDHYIKILDMSIGGLLIETNKHWDTGEEYILHVEYDGKRWPIRGYFIWSALKGRKDSEESIPLYWAGMKLTSDLHDIHELLTYIRLRLKQGEKNEYFSLSLDNNAIQEQGISKKLIAKKS